MQWTLDLLAKQAFVALFLVVAAGYVLGGIQIKKIGLGSTAATLIVGIALSLLAAAYDVRFQISEFASTVFFNLFMFSVGMKVGPQFLVGLRRDAKNFVIIALFIPAVSIGLMLLMRQVFTLEPGMNAGIFAGANTATPGLGAAQAAITGGATRLPAGVTPEAAVANLSTAFAFTYCASVVLFAVLIKLPDLLGRDSVRAARELEESLRGGRNAALPGATDEFFQDAPRAAFELRAYEVVEDAVVGRPLRDLRAEFPRISLERIQRGDKIIPITDTFVLNKHDIVTAYGDVAQLVAGPQRVGPEVTAREALDVKLHTVDVVIANREVVGRKLSELTSGPGHGLYLEAMFRAGDEIPFGGDTILRKGDVLRVVGTESRIAQLEHGAGKVVGRSIATDVATLAFGVALGGLIGAITIPINGIALQVGAAVGLLVVGMTLSIVRTRNPTFGGPYPEPARQLIEDLGLNVFVAVLGLNAGTGVVTAIEQGAIGPIIIACLIVGFIPPILAWLLGAYVLKMNDALLMGAVAGGRCSSPGMRAAQETTHSNVPTLSYPATFAISNIVFTVLAYVMAVLG